MHYDTMLELWKNVGRRLQVLSVLWITGIDSQQYETCSE